MKGKLLLALAVLAFVPAMAFAQADHLLISELYYDAVDESFGDADETGEYIEILNPTGGSIDLSNYYISDLVNSGAADQYWRIAEDDGTVGTVDAGGSGDFCVKFPNGTILAPGQVVVVINGALNWATRESLTFPSGLVFEVVDTDPGVPNMTDADSGAGSLSLTNSGEAVVLFFWDGASDLVTDIDILSYEGPSSSNAFTLKTTSNTVDGPDGDAVASAYNNDGAIGDVSGGSQGQSIERVSDIETGEGTTGGNGFGGDDETSETVSTTFAGGSTATPGSSALSPVQTWAVY